MFCFSNEILKLLHRTTELSVKQKEKLKESRGSLLKAAIASLRIFFKTEGNKEVFLSYCYIFIP